MAFTDCTHCLRTPCNCGFEYRRWNAVEIEELIARLQDVLTLRTKHPELLPPTMDCWPADDTFMEAMRGLWMLWLDERRYRWDSEGNPWDRLPDFSNIHLTGISKVRFDVARESTHRPSASDVEGKIYKIIFHSSGRRVVHGGKVSVLLTVGLVSHDWRIINDFALLTGTLLFTDKDGIEHQIDKCASRAAVGTENMRGIEDKSYAVWMECSQEIAFEDSHARAERIFNENVARNTERK